MRGKSGQHYTFVMACDRAPFDDPNLRLALKHAVDRERRPQTGDRRYFGTGDVLRNATLQFDQGARVEIDSLFENCVVELGEGTSLVVGKGGVLAGPALAQVEPAEGDGGAGAGWDGREY